MRDPIAGLLGRDQFAVELVLVNNRSRNDLGLHLALAVVKMAMVAMRSVEVGGGNASSSQGQGNGLKLHFGWDGLLATSSRREEFGRSIDRETTPTTDELDPR